MAYVKFWKIYITIQYITATWNNNYCWLVTVCRELCIWSTTCTVFIIVTFNSLRLLFNKLCIIAFIQVLNSLRASISVTNGVISHAQPVGPPSSPSAVVYTNKCYVKPTACLSMCIRNGTRTCTDCVYGPSDDWVWDTSINWFQSHAVNRWHATYQCWCVNRRQNGNWIIQSTNRLTVVACSGLVNSAWRKSPKPRNTTHA